MNSARRLPVRYLPATAVISAGILLRLVNLIATAKSPFFTRPVIDGQVYDEWALAISQGRAPTEPFYQDPLYPYYLALHYVIFGHQLWAVYISQLLLAGLFLWFVYDLTRQLFDDRAGLAAAALAALCQPLIFYDAQIEKTALAVFLTGLTIWAFVRAMLAARLTMALLAGLVFGLAVLTRANLLIFAPLLPILLLKAHKEGHRWWQGAIAAAVGMAIVILPVVIRNTLAGRELLLTTTQAGQNFYIGNSPYNVTGQYVAPPWVRPNPQFEQEDFRAHAETESGRRLSYSQVSSFYFRAGLKWIVNNPGRFLALLGRKITLYFNNYEVPDNQDMYFFARYSPVLRLPLPGFGIIFGLGVAGMLLARSRYKFLRISLILFFFGYALSVIAFFVFSRYRLPALPALLPFAGAMIVALWELMSRLKRRQPQARARLAMGLGLVLLGTAPTLLPVHRGSGGKEAAQCLANLAARYYWEGDTARAIEAYQSALAEHPEDAEALRCLGIIALNRQEPAQAKGLLMRAQQSDVTNPVTHFHLGRAYEELRQFDSAYIEYRRAVNLAPGRVEYRFSLATALQKLGMIASALAQYDTMVGLQPENPRIRHNYSVALYIAGQLQAAREQYELAQRLGGTPNPQYEMVLRRALQQLKE